MANVFKGPADGCPRCLQHLIPPMVWRRNPGGSITAAYMHSCGKRWITDWDESVTELPYNWTEGQVPE